MSDVWRNYPLNLVTNEADGTHRRTPAFDFWHPVCECRLGRNDKMWPRSLSIVLHVTHQRDGLQCFAETLYNTNNKNTPFYITRITRAESNLLGLLGRYSPICCWKKRITIQKRHTQKYRLFWGPAGFYLVLYIPVQLVTLWNIFGYSLCREFLIFYAPFGSHICSAQEKVIQNWVTH